MDNTNTSPVPSMSSHPPPPALGNLTVKEMDDGLADLVRYGTKRAPVSHWGNTSYNPHFKVTASPQVAFKVTDSRLWKNREAKKAKKAKEAEEHGKKQLAPTTRDFPEHPPCPFSDRS